MVTREQESVLSTPAVRLLVRPGAIIQVDSERLCVRAFESADAVRARNVMTGVERLVRLSEISASSAKPDSRADIAAIPEEEWNTAYEQYQIIKPLLDRKQLRVAAIKQVAEERGISVATLYRWLEAFKSSGSIASLLRKRRKDAGNKRLSDEVETLIKRVVTEEYLTDQKKRPAKAYRTLMSACAKAGVKAPSYLSFLRRLDEILPEERAKARNERRKASRLEPISGALPWIDTPMGMLQIDHTQVDIELVDEVYRIAIGKPWLTVAICVHSRLVAGWYVSLDPPGSLAVGMCISRAVLSKDKFLAELNVSYPWPCQGIPGVVHMDNAREFRGNALKLACQNHGFDLQFRPVKKPKYGAHIERLLGTLMREVHTLPGTTFSNPRDKEDYDSSAKAAMTLAEFEQWLAHNILGHYHQQVHSALRCSPLKRYMDGIVGSDDKPGIGALTVSTDPERLWIDFLPYVERTIQAYGVEIDNIIYQDPALHRWIGAKDPSSRRRTGKFIFRRDPRDISYVLFYDPELMQYFRIPYRDSSHPPISLWELKAAQRFLREQGRKAVDEESIFAALEEMRRIEKESVEKTRTHARNAERRRRHQEIRERKAVAEALAPKPEEDHFDASDITPFEEIRPMRGGIGKK